MPAKREPNKVRQWEQQRRDRLKSSLNELEKLLPCYDPSKQLKRIEIIDKAAKYIEELQNKVKELLSPAKNDNKTEREEIEKLCHRVKNLLERNQQLKTLLQDAGITIPTECGTVKTFRTTKWSNKITPEKAEVLAKKELQKENDPKKFKKRKTAEVRNAKVKKRKVLVSSGKVVKRNVKKKPVNSVPKTGSGKTALISLQPSQQYYIINDVTPVAKTSCVTSVTNVLQTTPLITSQIKPTSTIIKKPTSNLNSLGAGTLIFPNGNIVPILPQGSIIPNQPTIVTANSTPRIQPPPPPRIIVKQTPVNTPTFLVMPPVSKPAVSTQNMQVSTKPAAKPEINSIVSRMFPRIRPKTDKITKTTTVNKLPIPALTSRFAATSKIAKAPQKVAEKNNKTVILEKKDDEKQAKKATKRKLADEGQHKENEVAEKKKKDNETPSENVENQVVEKVVEVTEKENEEVVEVAPEKDVAPQGNEDKEVGDEQNKKTSYSIDSLCKENQEEQQGDKEGAADKSPLEAEGDVVRVEEPNVSPNKEKAPVEEEKSGPAKEAEITVPVVETEKNFDEISNDIFASLQVPTGGQNPESTSPTAAFLLAFPLVSSLTGVKVAEEVMEEETDSRHDTPTLLQIGTMDNTKPTQSQSDSLTPSLLNLDNFSFFNSKDICGLYQPFDSVVSASACPVTTQVTTTTTVAVAGKENQNVPPQEKTISKQAKIVFEDRTTKSAPKTELKENFPAKPQQPTSVGNAGNFNQLPNYSSQNVVNNNNNFANQSFNTKYYNASNKSSKQSEKLPACSRYTNSTKNYPSGAEYNTFDPFTDVPKSSSIYTYTTNISKSYNEPIYSQSNYSYNYQLTDNNAFDTNYLIGAKNNANKSSTNLQNQNYCSMNYDYHDYGTKISEDVNFYGNQANSLLSTGNMNKKFQKATTNNNNNKVNQPRQPVNWMTTPDVKQQNEVLSDFVPPNSFYVSNTFPSSNSQNYLYNSALESFTTNSFQRTEMEQSENQFPWSPTKLPQLLEPNHGFVSSTLPTLVGDLALGTNAPLFNDKNLKDNQYRTKDQRRQKPQNFDSQNTQNFLSVSQLVDHNKTAENNTPSRIANRRSSGNRASKSQTHKANIQTKRKTESKDVHPTQNYNANLWVNAENKTSTRTSHKNPSNNYSAEALIGQSDDKSRQHVNYPISSKSIGVAPFFPDNIIPYFPSVDIQQDANSFTQQNQNYQPNTYPTTSLIQPSTITTSYLPTTNFIPEITPHDYNSHPILPDNLNLFPRNTESTKYQKNLQNHKHQNQNTSSNRNMNQEDSKRSTNLLPPILPTTTCNSNTSYSKKISSNSVKKKLGNDGNLPNFVDFGFLSMPAAINSPILPDDFHTHTNFLPPPTPTQLYPCKNPLYGKDGADLGAALLPPIPPAVTRANIQHPEISPSLNNSGTSLTNFNLSTIFPEINKGSLMPGLDVYPHTSKIKDYNLQRNYLPNSSQGPFNPKSTFSSPYINTLTTTQSFTG